jgi:hypothetical protein
MLGQQTWIRYIIDTPAFILCPACVFSFISHVNNIYTYTHMYMHTHIHTHTHMYTCWIFGVP